MALTYWKPTACLLGLGAVGLFVWADARPLAGRPVPLDGAGELLLARVTPDGNTANPKPPFAAPVEPENKPLALPSIYMPTDDKKPTITVIEATRPVEPMRPANPLPGLPTFTTPKKLPEYRIVPSVPTVMQAAPLVPPAPPPPSFAAAPLQPVPPSEAILLPAPPPPEPVFAAPPKRPEWVSPAATKTPEPVAVKPASRTKAPAAVPLSPWRMLVRIGDGQPRFEIREGDDVLVKVHCDRIDLAAPQPGQVQGLQSVTALGNVKVIGPGFDATCEQVNIIAGKGDVVLKGHVNARTHRGKSSAELAADQVIFSLGTGSVSGTNVRVKNVN